MSRARPEVEDRWAEVQGIRAHCLAAGDRGRPVVLLHGGGLDAANLTYRFTFGPLSQHYRVLAPDWPGFGESEPLKGESTIAAYIDFLGSFLDAFSLPRASLVGLSMGGGMALGFALLAPERVERLVLVDSYGLGGEVPYGTLTYLMVHSPLVNDLLWTMSGWSHSTVRRSLEGIFHDRGAISKEMVEEVYERIRMPGAGEAWRSLQQSEILRTGLRTNYVDRLPELQVPTLILHGGQDRLVPVTWAERASRLIPGAELRIIQQCGHWTPREQPEEFNRELLRFLGS